MVNSETNQSVKAEQDRNKVTKELRTTLYSIGDRIIVIALYPKIGKPWNFAIHQCSYPCPERGRNKTH